MCLHLEAVKYVSSKQTFALYVCNNVFKAGTKVSEVRIFSLPLVVNIDPKELNKPLRGVDSVRPYMLL
jgi:hypothetical protein